FLDELPEFGRAALEALRQPLEDGEVSLVRARDRATMPARFMLLGAMNPCPCGHSSDANPSRCHCTLPARENYRRRISGPILDRFDLHIEVNPLRSGELLAAPGGETSAAVRARVERAREIQRERFRELPGVYCNAQLSGPRLRELCHATPGALERLARAIDSTHLSARAHDRILKLARTVADLRGNERVTHEEIDEASQLRCLDRPLTAQPNTRQGPLAIARKVAAHAVPGASPGELPREGT
ncbi:MAG TPA: ATP-binding protein, partial [Myxococcales bacterium]|nr:ATP-binding protein [Myxococcales bacterium]